MKITDKEKQIIKETAKKTVEAKARGKKTPPPPTGGVFDIKTGIFVTIKKNKILRGCIGYIKGVFPLGKAVIEMAESAGFSDPRFPPVSESELAKIDFEISVLSPLEKIELHEIEKIEVGKHGIYLKNGYSSGLLLPQVAVEYSWNRDEFLNQTCIKAGLPKEAYKSENTEIYIFSAEIF